MVDKIYSIKNRLIERIEKDMQERGADRIDGEMVDMVKDLASAEKDCWEAEYYRAVTEAMDGKSGYMPDGANYGPRAYQGRTYGMNRSRRGYDSMGHGDSVEGIRNILMMAGPDEKERMKSELRTMLDM